MAYRIEGNNAAAQARIALRGMFARVWRKHRPPPKLSYPNWAINYRVMSEEESSIKGRFTWEVSPGLKGIAEAASQPNTRKITVQKSAQVGYTAGIVCNIIGYNVHYRPSVIVAAFPRSMAAKDFASEKLDPMIMATPVLSKRIALRSRAQGNSMLRKRFPGGLIKLVGTNSPSDVKSTSARIVIVEEPDDASSNVQGQGNSLKLLEERAKTYNDHLILIGGTPTATGASAIEDEMKKSDKRYFHVPCHSCGETHPLAWENVTIPEDKAAKPRDVYGHHQWEQAFYTCPHCGTVWTDEERITNLRRAEDAGAGWVATADSTVPGFYLNELMSTFDGSRVPVLARKYLEAKDNMDRGDVNDMIAFWNSTLGLTWEYKGELPEEDELRVRAEKYVEWSCPAGGVEALMTVDVQHDRLAVTVWVFGRGEEMWLSYWGEHYGQTVVAHEGAWIELEQLMRRAVQHATGASLGIRIIGIDSGDGQTSEAVYSFCRKHSRTDRPVLALKGASDDVGRVEIWTPPKAIDPNTRATKASRAGVKVHLVGTAKAKDLILGWSEQGGRIRLEGAGPGRMHWYEGVRDDFYEQILGEIKIPSRNDPRKRVWKERKDRAHEVLDCTVYAVYLYRHLKLHLRKPVHWDVAERSLRQAELLLPEDDGVFVPPTPVSVPLVHASALTSPPPAVQFPTPVTTPSAKVRPRRPQSSNSFSSPEWGDRL
jgi:phage terminase large subunit GpA-like protein